MTMLAWLAPELRGTALGAALSAPERVLADRDTRFVKDHARTAVAAATVDGRAVFIKRWKPHRWYRPLVWLLTGTPGSLSGRSAAALEHAGFRVPEPLAIAERRTFGVPVDSYFVNATLPQSRPVGEFWNDEARGLPVHERAVLLRALAAELARFHDAGFYSRDANADNFLVVWKNRGEAPQFYFIDLENVRHVGQVSRRRRVKNLVQLYRIARGRMRLVDRARFLRAYFGMPLARRRDWLGELAAVDDRKEREYARRRAARARPTS